MWMRASRSSSTRCWSPGLHYTRPTVVTPRVTVRPGEPLDQSALLDSQRKLYNLALFNEVDTAVQNPSADQPRKNVLLLTTEAKRWDATYGFGFQAQTGTPYRNTPSAAYLIQQGINPGTFSGGANGHFGVSPDLIFDLSRINLFGTNQSVTLRTQYGTLEQQAVLLYQYPELFKNPNFNASVSGGYTSSQNVTTFAASSLFATTRVTQHVTKPTTLIYSWSYREVKVNPNSIQVSLALIPLLVAAGTRRRTGVQLDPRYARRSAGRASRHLQHGADVSFVFEVRIAGELQPHRHHELVLLRLRQAALGFCAGDPLRAGAGFWRWTATADPVAGAALCGRRDIASRLCHQCGGAARSGDRLPHWRSSGGGEHAGGSHSVSEPAAGG